MSPASVPRPRSDVQLMEQAQRGDAQAFGQLYDRHARRMLALAAHICGQDAAEDATQAAFASAWRDRGRYLARRGTVPAWLCMYARQRAIDLLRRECRHRERISRASARESSAPSHDDETAALAAGRLESARLLALLAGIPAPQRRVIELAVFGGLTQREIATALDLPVGTAKSRMRLGLDRLRAREQAGRAA